MKKSVLVLILSICVFTSVFAAGKAKLPEKVYVSVETVALKEKPGRFAKTVATVEYTNELQVLGIDGDWYQVYDEFSGVTGWISTGMVTKRKIIAGREANASNEEIALAGKGFSQEVEDLYKQNSDIDFSLVDAMESLTVSDEEMLEFLTQGNLRGEY